jgi:hypothetical protein
MNKKVWSILFLCLIFILFICTIALFVRTGISFYQLKNVETDASNDEVPGASIIGVVFASIGLWIGLIFFGGITSSLGFLCSLINMKIAQNRMIHRISNVFLVFYSGILILLFVLLIASVF